MNPVIQGGTIRCYRLFDVGDEIELQAATKLVGTASLRSTQVQRRGARAMEFVAVPVCIPLGKRMLSIVPFGPAMEAELELHVYSFGTVSLCVQFPIPAGTMLQSLALGPLYEAMDMEALGRRELGQILPKLNGSIRGAHDWSGCETYTIIHVHEFQGGQPARELLAWPTLPHLLLGEPYSAAIAPDAAKSAVDRSFSYFDSDLVVIDWNSALLVDPEPASGIAELLEFANCQLLNLRYHDQRLEQDIQQLHQAFGKGRRGGLFGSPYGKLAQDLFRRLLDIHARIERIDNSIKVAGNYHLAKVYEAAIERLGVSIWRQSIERKHALAATIYGMLNAETDHRRGLWLEITVVALILIEIILAIVAGH